MTEIQTTRVAVNGYGVIGKRVASAVVRQADSSCLASAGPAVWPSARDDSAAPAQEAVDESSRISYESHS